MTRIYRSILFVFPLFILDLLVIGFLGFPFLQSVYCFMLAAFLNQKIDFLFYISFLLLGLESFVAFDLFGLNFLYLVPLFLLLNYAIFYLSSKEITGLIWVVAMIMGQRLLVSIFKLTEGLLQPYTLWQIGANLIVLLVSLKWFSTVEQGNRF